MPLIHYAINTKQINHVSTNISHMTNRAYAGKIFTSSGIEECSFYSILSMVNAISVIIIQFINVLKTSKMFRNLTRHHHDK